MHNSTGLYLLNENAPSHLQISEHCIFDMVPLQLLAALLFRGQLTIVAGLRLSLILRPGFASATSTLESAFTPPPIVAQTATSPHPSASQAATGLTVSRYGHLVPLTVMPVLIPPPTSTAFSKAAPTIYSPVP